VTGERRLTYSEFRELCNAMYRDHRTGPKVLRLTRLQSTVLALDVLNINRLQHSPVEADYDGVVAIAAPIAPPVTSIVNPVTGHAVPIEIVA
jgi:hypothetical protein